MSKRIFIVLALSLALLWLGSPTAVLSTPPKSPEAPLGSGFSYQGFLKSAGGTPIHSTCDLRFSLWDDSSLGTKYGVDSTVTGVNVVYGYFSVQVNANGEFGIQPMDNTVAFWLEVEVKCSGDAFYTKLGPRQRLSRTLPNHDHWNQSWSRSSASGVGLTVIGSYRGLWASGDDGVVGYSGSLTGYNHGVYGQCSSTSGYGVHGFASASTGQTYGVAGTVISSQGTGVKGNNMSTTGTNYGVAGYHNSDSGYGVYGRAYNTNGFTSGVRGESSSINGRGVLGSALATTGNGVGVYGMTNSPSGYAGYFSGPVYIQGPLQKPGGSFQIDHPLDPQNQFLNHSFVESPDMMNIYNGIVTLDANGEAWVELPKWFEALNQDFRYQLTCIGGFAPVYIAQKIQDNRFKIAGGLPGMEVSWQVTGVRHDPWAEANRIPVEQPKPPEQQGLYLHPELFGQPKEQGIGYEPAPE